MEEAGRCYEELLRLAPEDAYAKARLLRLRTATKEQGDAEKEIDRMLRIPSRREDTALLSVKAEQLKKKGDYRAAAEVYTRILQTETGPQLPFFKRIWPSPTTRAPCIRRPTRCSGTCFRKTPQDVYVRNALVGAACKSGRREELHAFLISMARLSPANRALYGIARRLSNGSENDPG